MRSKRFIGFLNQRENGHSDLVTDAEIAPSMPISRNVQCIDGALTRNITLRVSDRQVSKCRV